MVLSKGCAWFYSGGMHGFIRGGMHGFILGGACVVFSVFPDTMRYGQWAGSTHPTVMHSCQKGQCHILKQATHRLTQNYHGLDCIELCLFRFLCHDTLWTKMCWVSLLQGHLYFVTKSHKLHWTIGPIDSLIAKLHFTCITGIIKSESIPGIAEFSQSFIDTNPTLLAKSRDWGRSNSQT